jgi:hypothetical protein
MNTEFSDNEIRGSLTKSYIGEGIKKYRYIMDSLRGVDVSKDGDFQTRYNHFYRVQRRGKAWYAEYYSFMERNKNNKALGLEEILCHLYRCFERVEFSFSSKILATINPDMPIWDKQVMENAGLRLPPGADKKRKLEESIISYANLTAWYGEYMKSENGKRMIELFDASYPGASISDTRKIDFVLWQMRNAGGL